MKMLLAGVGADVPSEPSGNILFDPINEKESSMASLFHESSKFHNAADVRLGSSFMGGTIKLSDTISEKYLRAKMDADKNMSQSHGLCSILDVGNELGLSSTIIEKVAFIRE
jgi:hypothetical protein